jgi:hypothetical protein
MRFFDALTAEQQKLPYAKYLDRPYPNPVIPPNVAQKIKSPMNPVKSLKMESLNDLLDPGYAADDIGYCIQEDGTGYVGETIFFKGSTREMFLWWFAWHGHEPVRYQLWDPRAHKSSRSSARHIARRLDYRLSWNERFLDTTNFTIHLDRAGIPDPATMSFVRPQTYAFDIKRYNPAKVSLVCALNGKADNPLPSFSSLRVLRDTSDGFVLQIYFWHGKAVVNNKFVRLAHDTPIEVLEALAEHCAEEYNRLADILPFLYEENHQIVNTLQEFDPFPV